MNLQSITTNWRTTTGGLLLLLLAAAHSILGITIPNIPLPNLDPGTIAIAFGLIMAKDGVVTGGNVKQTLS